MQGAADGGGATIPTAVKVTWTLPTTATALLPDDGDDPDPLPDPGVDPTAVFINNSSRPDRDANLAGVLFVLDPGTEANGSLQVSAHLSGAVIGDGGELSASIVVSSGPVVDATRGGQL